jgi:tetratricopeptide (TPR) repeat protein
MNVAPTTVTDWCIWASAEQREGRSEQAAKGFRQALAIESRYFPALFGLGSVLLEMGDLDGASTIAARMASADAARPDVLWLQARLAQARGEAGRARDLLVRLIADARLNDEQRAEALLALGLASGDLGQNADAFAAALRGKQMQRALYAAAAEAREGEVAKLGRIAAWLGEQPAWEPLSRPEVPGAAATHVFLLGFPRSGTTLLEQVLAAHPRVSTLEEEATLATAYQAFLFDAEACDTLTRLGADEAEAWAAHYWREVQARGVQVEGRLFVDKQPAGTLHLPIIARFFPRAKILFAVRDPRDVVLSCFRQAFRINAMTYAFTDLAETAACYDACMALSEEARVRLPLAWIDVRHERLVEDFDRELARVLEFLELQPDPAMADFASAAATRSIRTPSATQVRAGLNRRGLGRWEQFQGELAPVLPTLAPWVERFGYSP